MKYCIVVSFAALIATLSLCSAASVKSQDPPCRAEVSRIQKEHLENNWYLQYVVLPQCDEDGYYKSLQITVYGYSCVTSQGSQVDYNEYNARGPCNRLKRCVRRNQVSGAKDHKLIRCDRYGYFRTIQETEAGKICVNVYGHILKTDHVNQESDCRDVSIMSAFRRQHRKYKPSTG